MRRVATFLCDKEEVIKKYNQGKISEDYVRHAGIYQNNHSHSFATYFPKAEMGKIRGGVYFSVVEQIAQKGRKVKEYPIKEDKNIPIPYFAEGQDSFESVLGFLEKYAQSQGFELIKKDN